MDAKKLKLIVKGDKKSTFGTDPNEPWSVRAGITESERGELHAYLKSRGINPEFVSKDTKISHAKSSEFQKWRRDHQFDDPINFVSTTAADRMKLQRAQTEEVTSEAWDNSATKIKKSLRAGTYNSKPTALDKFRAAAAERAKKHDDAEKEMKARHAAGKEDMKGAIDRLEKQLNKEEIEHTVGDSVTVNSKFFGKQKGKVTKVDSQSVHVVRDGKSSAEKYPHDAVVKEEIEQIDELNYDTVKSLYKKRRDDFHGAQIGKKKKGKEVSAKNVSRSISRLTGFKPTQNQPQKEEFEFDEAAGISKTKETKFHKKLDKLVHSTFGKRKDEMKMKEEVVTEKNVPTSPEKWAQAKSQAKAKFDVYPSAYANGWASKKYKEMGGGWKSVSEAKDEREYGYEGDMALNQLATLTRCADMIKELLKPDTDLPEWVQSKITLATDYIVTAADYLHSEMKEEVKQIDELKKSTVSEDVFQDSQAATQTAFDMGTQADDREPVYSKRKELSKSARIIKSLYKKHKMVKEELYDHEKEDKSVATYGKKPKTEKQEVYGDDDAQAAMILKGGTTLTGQTRDTLEIDPVMRKPVRPDNKISNRKTDK